MTRRGLLRKNNKGYTLLELLIVLVVIALIATLVSTQVFKYLGRARTEAAGVQLQKLSADIDFFRFDMRRLPTEEEGLNVLFEAPVDAANWQGPYVTSRKALIDPWGNAFHYRAPGQHGAYDLFSLGSDNEEGGTGEGRDIANWDDQ